MIKGKQVRYLRSLANTIEQRYLFGKGEVDEAFLAQLDAALEAKELIKVGILQNSSLSADELADILTNRLNCELVQHIGRVLVLFYVLPMWVNFLIRTLATKAIFIAIDVPLGMGTVIFGMVYNYLPFMILPLHTTLSSIDRSYIEAAQDLGADSSTVFLKTVLPLSVSGIISGITMVFIPTISTFAISQLLSNGKIFLFGDSIQMKFEQGLYGVGSIMSLVMLVFVLVSNFIINRASRKSGLSVGRSLW